MAKMHSVTQLIDPIFIVGNSRSGTTLMSRILKSHSKVYFLNETFMFDEISNFENDFERLTIDEIKRILRKLITIQRKGYYRKQQIEEYADEVDSILGIYQSNTERDLSGLLRSFYVYEATSKDKILYGDQTPRHVFSINWIIKAFPNSKIINMVRDPRAILLSQKNKWKASLKLHQPLFEVIRTKLNYHPFTISLLWNRSIDAGIAAEKLNVNGSSFIKTVIFEDLVCNANDKVKEVCDFIGIDFEPEMMNVDVEMSSNESEEGKKGVSTNIATTWKKRLSETEQVICEITVGDRLKKYGYDLSGSKISIIRLIGWTLLWPVHMGIVFVMNMGRMGGNPFAFFLSRLRPNK